MNITLLSTLEAIFIVTALSTDAFVASFAYGSNKIKIPFQSVTIINVVCSAILAVSLFLGSIVSPFFPESLSKWICFSILFILSIVKLSDSFIKSIIRRKKMLNKEIKFSLFNFKFILNVYADPEKADVDNSKVLSPLEAATLSIALSLDGLAVGFGAGLGDVNSVEVVLFSLISDMVAVMAGCWLGNKVAEKIPLNLSWVSGLLLLVLAFIKL